MSEKSRVDDRYLDSRSSHGGVQNARAGCRDWHLSWPGSPAAVGTVEDPAEAAATDGCRTGRVRLGFEADGEPQVIGPDREGELGLLEPYPSGAG
jgi:hypothetical protein